MFNSTNVKDDDFNFGIPDKVTLDPSCSSEEPLEVTKIKIADIIQDPDLQLRVQMDAYVVEDYAEKIKRGKLFPPVTVFKADDGKLLLADGWHTFEATIKSGQNEITANVRSGGKLDALKYAAGANSGHGLRRNNQDKRRGVKAILKEFSDWSNRQIAEVCDVSDVFVGRVRTEVEQSSSNKNDTRVGRDGVTRRVPTKNTTGRSNAPTQNESVMQSPVTISEIDFSRPCEELRNNDQISKSEPLVSSQNHSPTCEKLPLQNDLEVIFNGKIVLAGTNGVYFCTDNSALLQVFKIIQAEIR